MPIASSKQSFNSSIFSIPSKLYGRDVELDNMQKSFNRVIEGGSELLFITGDSGVGKSSLIGEFEQAIHAEDYGTFLTSGKSDKLERNIPYYPLIQAFDEVLQHIIQHSNEFELALWKKRFGKALGGIGKILTDLIPKLKELIGVQPELPSVRGHEAMNRFNYAFQRFVATLATRQRPLILFIDDLQWADNASLMLIKTLTTSQTIKYFMFIGAYRANEVKDDHPLTNIIDDIGNIAIEQGKRKIYHINLHNLSLVEVNQLVADSLKISSKDVKELSPIIYKKTLGNPFFTRQLLRKLYDDSLITYDTYRYLWIWNIKDLENVNITENVVDLMLEKLRELPESTREVLKVASCIGRRFDIDTLEIIINRLQTGTYDTAFNAVRKHLKRSKEEGFIFKEKGEYFFSHDRIHYSVNQLSNRLFRKKVHLHIGRLLFSRLASQQTISISNIEAVNTEDAFNIIMHWNKGGQFIDNKIEKSQLAALNLIAGKKALKSAAFKVALEYFKRGVELLYDDSWRRDYDLTLDLYTNLMEAQYLNGDMAELPNHLNYINKHVQNPIHALSAYEINIQSLSAQQQLSEAADLGLTYLKELGLSFPNKINKIQSLWAIIRMSSLMAFKKPEELYQLPEMTDKRALAIMNIFKATATAFYLGGSPFLPLYIFRGLKVTLKYGNSPSSVFAYGGYGLIASGVLKRYEVGYEYGELISSLINKFGAVQLSAFAALVKNTFLIHPQKHLKNSIQPTAKAYRIGLETGSVEFTPYVALTNAYFSFFIGTPLTEVTQTMEGYIKKMDEFNQELAAHRMRIYQETFHNLSGRSGNTYQLRGESYDETTMLQPALDKNVTVIKSNYLCNKLVLTFLFREYDMALEHSLEAEKPTIQSARGSYMLRMYYFYSALTFCKILQKKQQGDIIEGISEKKLRKKTRNYIQLIKKWSVHVHENFLHKYKLIEAEMSALEGRDDDAKKLYREALLIAEKEEFMNEVALICELAADYYIRKDEKIKAKAHLNKAIRAYTEWEAHAKVKDLKNYYKELLQ
jgi:predicted ATPase